MKHLLYTPFTGLGLYDGFRGNAWLRNRIKIFKQFVVPSLQAQTSLNFILWISWRREERNNPIVKEFIAYLDKIPEFKTVHTFNGLCFYDDKYPEREARERLITAIHASTPALFDIIGECDYVLMTIQPSDDLYHKRMVENVQKILEGDLDAAGFTKGYMCNYLTKEVCEYNPLTNPPFYTIKFPRDTFFDPLKHLAFTSLKRDSGKYKKGTPLPSHEYIADCMRYGKIDVRGFVVGCHKDNVSTFFDSPYKGDKVDSRVLEDFGVSEMGKLVIPFSLGRFVFDKLSHQVKRKLRFWAGEKKWVFRPFFNLIYNLLRA